MYFSLLVCYGFSSLIRPDFIAFLNCRFYNACIQTKSGKIIVHFSALINQKYLNRSLIFVVHKIIQLMKKLLLSFVVALAIVSCTQAQKTEFTPAALASVMITTDKSETSFQKVIEANKGKIVVIDVWASWCSDCIKGLPKYKELQKQFPDVVYLNISMDRNWESWIIGTEKNQVTGQNFWAPDGMKGTFGKEIDLSWIPRYMVIDQEGKIALYNAIEADDAKIATTLTNLQTKQEKKSKR